jgi:putative nucleotidyltransferase with HDIG domain
MTAHDGKKMIAAWLEEGGFAERLPEVERLKEVPQSEEYHGEGDAFVHTMLAVQAVADEADIRVFWGALLHDIGKRVTTKLVHGRWRSFGHAEAGAKMTPAIMERLGMPELAQDVTWLVKHHQFHFSWQLPPGAKPTRNQLRFMEHPLFPLLLQVCVADGRASHGKSGKGEMVDRLAELYADQQKKSDSRTFQD